jgi:glycosyltransferase involved in cell wall biosynthesis
MPKVSAVVPAYNEAATIAGVIQPLLDLPLIDEIIVVNDGSSDDTAARARGMGARVISIPVSGGKAAAMARGVTAARHDILYFSDADVTGLTSAMVASIVEPVARREFAMFVGIRGRKTYWANRLLHFTPIIGGQRALRRELWDQVPSTYKKNFQIEIALNFFAKQRGYHMGFKVMPAFGQVIKERKRGLVQGLWQRFSMIGDILIVSWRLYVLLQLQAHRERRLSRVTTASGP